MNTQNISNDEGQLQDDPRIHDFIKRIHQQYAPPLDLITCEVLDSILQSATAEQIALFSHVHVDTVRRILQDIESMLHTDSYSQIIDNCHSQQWSNPVLLTKEHKSYTFK
jgi:hypothetical protein